MIRVTIVRVYLRRASTEDEVKEEDETQTKQDDKERNEECQQTRYRPEKRRDTNRGREDELRTWGD